MFSISEAANILGVAKSTLRRWEKEGRFAAPMRTPGGHRRYDKNFLNRHIDGQVHEASSKKVACYCRVSGSDQRQDLEAQAEKLANWARENYPSAEVEVIKDLGSGLKIDKRGLSRLLRLILTQQIALLVINHRDRLLRFGSELIFNVCKHCGVEVVILEEASDVVVTAEEQLTRDVIALMTVFCARLHGKRSHQNRRCLAA